MHSLSLRNFEKIDPNLAAYCHLCTYRTICLFSGSFVHRRAYLLDKRLHIYHCFFCFFPNADQAKDRDSMLARSNLNYGEAFNTGERMIQVIQQPLNPYFVNVRDLIFQFVHPAVNSTYTCMYFFIYLFARLYARWWVFLPIAVPICLVTYPLICPGNY